jgi:hypothetical protein
MGAAQKARGTVPPAGKPCKWKSEWDGQGARGPFCGKLMRLASYYDVVELVAVEEGGFAP